MISGNTDIRQLAQGFIQSDRASKDAYFQTQQSQYQGKIRSYTTITQKVNDLQSVLSELSKNESFESFSVSQSQEGFADIEASGNAAAGEYRINVDQLASAQQYALDFASETDPVATSGQMTLGVGGDNFTIDMSTLGAGATLGDLRDAINNDAANPGVQASIVRTSTGVKMLLSSEESGAANTITMSTNGDPAMADIQAAMDGKTEISQAKDARIFMGENNSLELTSSTNTFDNVIDGLKIDVTKVHADPAEQLVFDVGQDSAATEEKLQGVVEKFNSVMLAIDGAREERLAGDSTTRLLTNQVRRDITDFNVGRFGIEITRNGRLEIDSEKLAEFIENDPDGLTQIMGGETGLIQKLDDRLDSYVKGNDSMLVSSKNSAQASLDQLNERMTRFDSRMEQQLNRYIQQFSAMQATISEMQQTSSVF